jgi:hypothetical protein
VNVRVASVVVACALAAHGGCAHDDQAATPPAPPRPADLRQGRDDLVTKGPAPGTVTTPPSLPAFATVDRVESDVGPLFAAAVRPSMMPLSPDTPVEKLPGLLWLHDGAVLDDDDFAAAASLAARGFIVLLPTFRGEHGNPGAFSMRRGEVFDARAALAHLAARDDVDDVRLYAVGHGEGGALAVLLALDDDVPLTGVAAIGALPDAQATRADRRAPFARTDDDAVFARTVVEHLPALPRLLFHAPLNESQRQSGGQVVTVQAPSLLLAVDLIGRRFAARGPDDNAPVVPVDPRPVPVAVR